MERFETIWQRALTRHPEASLRERFPVVAAPAELAAVGDDRYLAAMSKRVFAAGFRWRVIEAKWQGFEEAFHGFDPAWVAGLDAAGVAALAADTRIVRNRPKIVSTVNNARFVRRVAAEHGSFGRWLGDWPDDDVVGLWEALRAGGDRLGGDTGAWFLRLVGKDTFRFTTDVVAALNELGVIDGKATGKRASRAAQEAIDAWAAESGLSRGAVSVVLACSTGVVYGEDDDD